MNEESGIKKVALKTFADVVDLTLRMIILIMSSSHPNLDVASNEDENSSAAIVYTLPYGEGNPGEQGFVDGQKTDGTKT